VTAVLGWLWDCRSHVVMKQRRWLIRFIINGCSLDLEQLAERDLTALIDNQTKRVELLANELQLLMAEQRRRSDLRMQRLNSVA